MLRACGGAPTNEALCQGAQTFPFAPGTVDGRLDSEWPVRSFVTPELDSVLAEWRLTVDGLVEAPQVFSFTDLVCLERQDQLTDLHCVEGWSVEDIPWNGLHLSQLFERCRPKASARYVTFHMFEGDYVESLPLDVALERRSMLGYGVGERTLPLDHGFPLRMVIPRLLGYKNIKYIDRIELDDQIVSGVWEQLGLPYLGEVPPERLRPGSY